MSVPVHLIKQYSPYVTLSVSSLWSARAHSRSLSTSDCAIGQWRCLSLGCRTSRYYSQSLIPGGVSSTSENFARRTHAIGVLRSLVIRYLTGQLLYHTPYRRTHLCDPPAYSSSARTFAVSAVSSPTHHVVPLHSTAATASSRVVAILPNQASSYRLGGLAVSVSIVQRKKTARPSSG